MTTPAHLYRPITDAAGNLIPNCVVHLYQPGTTTAITDQAYSDAALTQPLANPFTCPSGVIDIYFNGHHEVRLGITKPGGTTETEFDYVDTSEPPAAAAAASASPLATFDFESGSVPAAFQFYWRGPNGNQDTNLTTSHTVDAVTGTPTGTTFTKALHLAKMNSNNATTGWTSGGMYALAAALSLTVATAARVGFWYKVVSDGPNPGYFEVQVDPTTNPSTGTEVGTAGVEAYRYDGGSLDNHPSTQDGAWHYSEVAVPEGSHIVNFLEFSGSGTTNTETYLGPVVVWPAATADGVSFDPAGASIFPTYTKNVQQALRVVDNALAIAPAHTVAGTIGVSLAPTPNSAWKTAPLMQAVFGGYLATTSFMISGAHLSANGAFNIIGTNQSVADIYPNIEVVIQKTDGTFELSVHGAVTVSASAFNQQLDLGPYGSVLNDHIGGSDVVYTESAGVSVLTPAAGLTGMYLVTVSVGGAGNSLTF